jgi:hypothetical protein
MDHVLTEHGLRLTYLRDQNAISDLDHELILDDLSDDTPDGDPFPWLTPRRLTECDHLVLVTDRTTGRHLAYLAANDGATDQEDFVQLQAAFVAPTARGQNLMRRMIAFAMLRIGGIRSTPNVIVTCSRHPVSHRIMRDIASRFTGAVFFPDPDSVAIDFRAATLAQRIARLIQPNRRFHVATGTIHGAMMAATGTDNRRRFSQPADRKLAVLDLRRQDEATILNDARRVYRSK